MDLEHHLRETLGDTYRIERELGGGGMSRVFEAEEVALGRRVALKVLTDVTSEVSGDRFRREIETVARLQHPHIVPLLHAGTADSTVYYTMPLVEGESIRTRLEREGRIGVREAVQYARDVAGALAYAHRHGVVHRDIKPDNVLLTGGHAVVTDFGIAKALALAADTNSLTATGLALGTPYYMAPEQALADPGADHRVDLYALGCLLFEMLAGRPPFEGRTAQQVLSGHLTQAPEALERIRPDVPSDVAAWVRRALAKSPDERWSTPAEALEELEACLGKLTGERQVGGPRAPGSRRRLVGVLGATAAVIAVGAGVTWYLHRGGTAPADETDRIAVMPFQPTDPTDTALTRLGRDLVVTLTANLDGVGDLRMIDPLSVLAQTNVGDPLDPPRALALAARMGAGSALVGTLVRAGTRSRLDYRLLPTSGAGDPIATGTVSAPLGDEGILALTDSATWGMLRAILPARNEPVPAFDLMPTRSVPALRAFIEGENHLLANRWGEAERSFARAIEADSTFWFAYRRVVQAADWIFSAARRAREDSIAWEHRASFPERERRLMEHHLSGRFEDALAALADITRDFPDYWYGWFQYADDMLHNGTRLGLTPRDAREPFERALALNPRLVPALDHEVVFMNDSAVAEDAVARMRSYYGRAWDTLDTDWGVSARALYGVIVDRRRSDGGAAALARYAHEIATRRLAPTLLDYTVAVPIFALDPQGQLEAARIARSQGAPESILTPLRQWDVLAWAMRGAWDSAFVALDGLWAERPTLGLARVRATLGVMAYVGGAVDEGGAMEQRRSFAEFEVPPASRDARERLLAFLDGMLAYEAGRSDELAQAGARLRKLTSDEGAGYLARDLDAFGLDLAGRREEALDSLRTIERERGGAVSFDYAPVPLIRLAAGRWAASGESPASADPMLSYYESGLPSVPDQIILKATAGPAAFERARAWGRAGDTAKARRYYLEFLRIYDRPPEAHRWMVEEARAALEGRGG